VADTQFASPVTAQVTATQSVAPSHRSGRALDALSLFLAALLAGYGPRAILYLVELGWGPAEIGFVLSASGVSAALTQVVAGDLIDTLRSKRFLLVSAATVVALTLLFLGFHAKFAQVLTAAILLGAFAGVLGIALRAISLGLVGCPALSERLGRNERYAALGGLVSGGALGIFSGIVSARAGFVVAAALLVPIIMALARVDPREIHYCRACGAPTADPIRPDRIRRVILISDRPLLIFAVCLFLFQLANAPILPLVVESLPHAGVRWPTVFLSALVVLQQTLVFIFAPWTGRTAQGWGRRPLLLIAFGVVSIRSVILGWTPGAASLVAIQAFSGLASVILGVVTTLVVADIAYGTGRFSLAQGLVATSSAFGAALSTSISGLIVEIYGRSVETIMLTIAGLFATAVYWSFMPETNLREAAN